MLLTAAQTISKERVVRAVLACLTPMKYPHPTAYIKKATAPATIDRASSSAYSFPWLKIENPRVAIAHRWGGPEEAGETFRIQHIRCQRKGRHDRAADQKSYRESIVFLPKHRVSAWRTGLVACRR